MNEYDFLNLTWHVASTLFSDHCSNNSRRYNLTLIIKHFDITYFQLIHVADVVVEKYLHGSLVYLVASVPRDAIINKSHRAGSGRHKEMNMRLGNVGQGRGRVGMQLEKNEGN